jgi:hypothetical protein
MERETTEVNPDDRNADGTREEPAPDYPVTTLPPKEREAEPDKEVGPKK